MSASNQSHITEYSILTSYLLTPSPLPTALPYSTFLSTCVPAAYRSHPHIKRLYRDLQFQRNIDVDAVRENIERECTRSGALRSQLARQIQGENGQFEHGRKRKRANKEHEGVRGKAKDEEAIKSDEDDEFNISTDRKVDDMIHNSSAHPASKVQPAAQKSAKDNHTICSLLLAMEVGVTSLEHEIDQLTSQNSELLAEITETVGQLSDLRYGRFARPSGANDEETFEGSIIEALTGLNGAMKRNTND